MRILFTLHDDFNLDMGGTGVIVGLGEVYRRAGHEVTYFSFDDLPRHLPFRAKALLFPQFVACHIERVHVRRRLDVVDASSGDAWLWAVRRRRPHSEGPLLVTRSHGLEHVADAARRHEARNGTLRLSRKYPLYWGGYRLWETAVSFRRADLGLFLNQIDRAYALAHFGLQPEGAHIVDNGIPSFLLDRAFGSARASAVGIAHIGGYLPMKGTHYLAAALNDVLARHSSLRVSFLGTGCEPERVLRDFDRGLHSRITVLPRYRRDELPWLLRDDSIVVSATLREGFGLGVLEAMACGLAPVATATPGPVQFVRHEENGLLVPPGDSGALADALNRLLANRDLLLALRRQAHDTAQRYSWKRIAHETLALYESAIEGREHLGRAPLCRDG
jgi:glycosyltransferase involved in cell wall biosynthesis